MQTIIGYEVRNRITGNVRKYGPAQRVFARRFADRKDLEYGAVICSIVPMFAPVARRLVMTAAEESMLTVAG